jgi:hypothetical protein
MNGRSAVGQYYIVCMHADGNKKIYLPNLFYKGRKLDIRILNKRG